MTNPPVPPAETTTPPVDGGDSASAESATSTYTPPATQADFDRIVQARVAREQAKFADYDDLKQKLKTFEDASKSEMDKAVEAAKQEGYQEAVTKTQKRILKSEIRTAASLAGFVDPDDAVVALAEAEIGISDDGDVDAAALEAALKELTERKPYLLKVDEKPASTRVTRGPRPKASEVQGPPGKQKASDVLAQFALKRKSS